MTNLIIEIPSDNIDEIAREVHAAQSEYGYTDPYRLVRKAVTTAIQDYIKDLIENPGDAPYTALDPDGCLYPFYQSAIDIIQPVK